MRSHELAKELLEAPDGEIVCSVDISTCEGNAEDRCFGENFEGINSLPTDEGFGSDEVVLLFSGNTNLGI